MLITFACTQCDTHLEIDANAAGSQVECPQCRTSLSVPRKGAGPGATVGGFRIKELIGKGGMGEVYLAHQLSLDRDVALKILPSQLSREKDDVDRFLQEVRLLARLEHPNIVTAYEAGEDVGVLYLAMALVRGDSVEKRIKEQGPYPEDEALEIIKRLASALAYAWNEHQLLHRDIKPSNILMDSHGEPKLADLGLAKSLTSGMQLTMVSTMMGTPNYMSPEQGEGVGALDCRTDIYSLGATLYHMLTGTTPFHGSTMIETLRKQATQSLPDPHETNPHISDQCVTLIERMLARDPANRHESWEVLIEDVNLVLAGEYPQQEALQSGESVMLRGEPGPGTTTTAKTRVRSSPAVQETGEEKPASRKTMVLAAVGICAALVIAAVGGWLMIKSRRTPPEPVAAATPAPSKPAGTETSKPASAKPAIDTRAAALGKQFEEALQYVREHGEDFAGAISRFETVRKTVAGTEWEKKAGEEILRIENARQKAKDDVVAKLKANTEALFEQGKMDAAIAQVRDYTGSFAGETAEARKEMAEALTKRAADARETEAKESQEAAKAKLDEAAKGIAGDLLKGDSAAVRRRIEETDKLKLPPGAAADWTAIKGCAEKALGTRDAILASFRQDEGREVTVGLSRGAEKLQIVRVEGSDITANKVVKTPGGVVASTTRNFRFEDLSAKEKMARLGDKKTPELDIMRGLLVWEAKNQEGARKLFGQSGSALGSALAGKIDELRGSQEAAALAEKKAKDETNAATAYQVLLRLVCPELAAGGNVPEANAVITAVRRKAFSEGQVLAIKKQTDEFRAKYAATEYAKTTEGVFKALDRVRPDMPQEIDPAALDKVKERLQKANPGEQIAWMAQMEEDGPVLDISKNKTLKDISPLMKLPLKSLDLSKTPISDLTPLKGMPLVSLILDDCQELRDLSPLKGIPLKSLSLQRCDALVDLRPLHGMPLASLQIQCYVVADLQPLRGLPLTTLSITSERVADLQPLKGLPLTSLTIRHCQTVTDLSPIKSPSLTSLEIVGLGKLSNLRPLEGMKLTSLTVVNCGEVADLTPLKGMPLTHLDLRGTAVADLSPLKEMPLTHLNLGGCAAVTDVRPLKDLPLRYLNLWRTHVTDLTPLKGKVTLMELLGTDGNQVRL